MERKSSSFEIVSRPYVEGWKAHEGDYVAVRDQATQKIYYGKIKIKAVRCGKSNCHKCPHKIYAYAQFRVGKKVREKYLGIAR